jgi:Flp pilus assembly pilin Flp
VKKLLKEIIGREEGQDLIEYGLLAAFISVVALVAIKAIGPLIVPLYEAVVAAITP